MKKIFAALALFFAPVLASAQWFQNNPNASYIESLFGGARSILGLVVPILVTLATIYFIWAVFQFIKGKDEATRKEARGKMIAGIIGLFVIVSVWGIIRLLGFTLGIQQGGVQGSVPCPPGMSYQGGRCQ